MTPIPRPAKSLSIIPAATNRLDQSLQQVQPKIGRVFVKFPSPFSHQALIQTSFPSNRRELSVVPFNAKGTGSGEEDHRALETVLKLYGAIKRQNIRELSEIIGDECRCVCNFFSFQPSQGKKEVLNFFLYLMRSLGGNIHFVVSPTLHDGMNVGVSWRLEWQKTHTPLGQGFSFHICHICKGKVMIRNVEMFMEPLFHVEPLRLKIMGQVLNILDKTGFWGMSKDKAKAAVYFLFVLLFVAVLMFFSKPGLY